MKQNRKFQIGDGEIRSHLQGGQSKSDELCLRAQAQGHRPQSGVHETVKFRKKKINSQENNKLIEENLSKIKTQKNCFECKLSNYGRKKTEIF